MSAPSTPLIQTVTHLRARYAETDAMGVVHHATYPVWFEVGRSDFMRAIGVPYAALEARGYYLMLSELRVRYRLAARYDDALTLVTRVSSLRSRAATFSYELWRAADGAGEGAGAGAGEAYPAPAAPALLLATGETHHICTDHAYRPARMPDELLTAAGGVTA